MRLPWILDIIFHSTRDRDTDLSQDDLKRLRFSAIVFLQSFVVGCVFIPVNYYFGGFWLSLYGVSFASVSLISALMLNKPSLQVPARIIFVTTANTMILGMYQHVGPESAVHFFFGPALSLPFLMYPKTAPRALLYSWMLPLVISIMIFLLPPILEPVVNQNLNLKIYGLISANLSVWMITFAFLFLHKINLEHEEKIHRQNATLIQSEKMSSLGIVAAGMAHEINNPITIISGTVQVLKRKANEGVLPKEMLDNYLDRIQNTAIRISKIVESLKVFSRNSLNDKNVSISIKTTIEQAIILCKKKLEGIEISLDCPNDIQVNFHSTELLQALVNLISNSSDAIQSFDQKWIRIEALQIGKTVRVNVIDCGPGIPEEVLKNLFTPFYTTKPVGLGTGLGLSVSRRLLENRGAQINYENIQGHTAFSIQIPLTDISDIEKQAA